MQGKIDSLYQLYNTEKSSIKKHTLYYDIGRIYVNVNLDSATSILSKTISEAKDFKIDSLIVKSQLGMALALSRMNQYDSAHFYYRESENILRNLENSELQKTLFINRGILFFYPSEYDKAGDEFQKALDVALEENHYEDMGRCYNNIALCRAYVGKYEEALEMHFKSAELAEKLGNQLSIAQSYNNIGLIYKDLEDFSTAEEYLLKSLTIKKKEGSNVDIIGAYINLGNTTRQIGVEKKNFEILKRAKDYYIKGLELSEKINYVRGRNNIYTSLSTIETTLNNYDASLTYGRKALKFSLDSKDRQNEMIARVNLGDALRYKRKFTESEKELLVALEISKEIKSLYYERETALLLSKLYGEKREFKKAFEYHTKFYALNDSIASKEIKNKINELETKYQTTKKEKEIALQEQEILDQELKIQNRNLYLLFISSALIITIVIVYGFYKRQQFKSQQLRKEIDLKDALEKIRTQNKLQEQRLEISRDLHDNIGSQLTFIISSIDNLKYISKDLNEKLSEKLAGISSFTFDTIHQLRDTIWAMNKNEIGIDELYGRVLSYLEKAKNIGGDIIFETNNSISEENVLSSVQGMNLFRVVQEAINNSIKHSKAKKIAVQFSQIENGIEISIKDDGIGFDKSNFDPGNGLSNMEHRVSNIDGKLSINTELKKGTEIIIKIAL